MSDQERKVGIYARVSTEEQDFGPQVERCREWIGSEEGLGVGGIWTEVAAGSDQDRPEQGDLMSEAMGRRIQVVAVAKVDRWARSLKHLAQSVERLHDRGVRFVAVDQGLEVRPEDPTSGLILNILGAVAEWEAGIISERTKEGLRDAENVGRPSKDCAVCGESRDESKWGKVHGSRVPLCVDCRALDPATRRSLVDREEIRDA